MKKLILIATIFACTAFASLADDDAVKPDEKAMPGATDTNYAKSIETRTEDILKVLALADPEKSAKVHDTIVNQYHALKAWHSANDPKLKSSAGDTNAIAEIKASLKAIHNAFLAKLGENLTPAQVDQVKDKMVYNKVQVTFNAYCDIIPQLTEPEKAHILEVLKEAREEAMDGGNVNEKNAIFKKYKGRIANYLAKEGIDEQKARKEWYARTQLKKTTPSEGTNAPAN